MITFCGRPADCDLSNRAIYWVVQINAMAILVVHNVRQQQEHWPTMSAYGGETYLFQVQSFHKEHHFSLRSMECQSQQSFSRLTNFCWIQDAAYTTQLRPKVFSRSIHGTASIPTKGKCLTTLFSSIYQHS